ncbi:hypothetical protein ABT392_05465 [Paucibacter sp. JuS9]|uniref:hypothetical protein n=1 Tax=Paucibacter sp. JuS9 TaxID=3228748 RepID=UPI0037570C81
MTCENCHGEKCKLWAIGPPYPTLREMAAGNQIALVRCDECGQLWVESFYEPFSAFRYAVQWPLSVERFAAIRNKDQGLTLCRWHEAEIKAVGSRADAKTLENINAHFERSHGLVDLRPSGSPNQVELRAA